MKMTVAPYSTRTYPSLVTLTFLSLIGFVTSEIRTFTGVIEATSTYIHYSEGYLVAPAFLDIGHLSFQTIDDGSNNGFVSNEIFPDDNGDDTPVDPGEGAGDDDSDASSESPNKDGSKSGGGKEVRVLTANSAIGGSTVDIVFFYEPKNCSNNRNGCDWSQLGIGVPDETGGTRWCCSNDAIDLGYCKGGDNQYGRLIVNSTTFKGQHRFISVPPSGKLDTKVIYGLLEEHDESGTYVLIIANCNDEGRDVLVSGQYTWKSKDGYLPGDMFGEMYFFVLLTFVYSVLAFWYGISMRYYDDASIPIQKWIFGTISLGLLESFFRTGDYFIWNVDGTRFWFAMYTGVIVGVLKRGISRALLVMVSLGWGVVRDSLGSTMKKIIALGIVYVGTSAVRDIMTLFAFTENETLSNNEEVKIFDAVTIATFVVAVVDVTFYMWILDALNGTMQYLENMNQSSKLQRYLRLRCILLFSILFAVVWSVFGMVNTAMEESILEEQEEWFVDAFMEINYITVLVGVAVLWRPNPNAKEYAYVTELSALGGEEGDDDLEMVGNIPSALDDDDDDDDIKENGDTLTKNGGYSDESGDGLAVRNAVNS